MPLVIYSLGGGHTHIHPHRSDFKKPDVCFGWCAPGLKSSGVHANSRKPTKVCNENETKKQEKYNGCLKYFLMEEGVYKAHAENWCRGYQTTSGH